MINNEEKYKNYKKRKILRIFIIIFGVLTLVLSVLSLTIGLGVGYALIAFVTMSILTRVRNNTLISENKHNIKSNNRKCKKELDKK